MCIDKHLTTRLEKDTHLLARFNADVKFEITLYARDYSIYLLTHEWNTHLDTTVSENDVG